MVQGKLETAGIQVLTNEIERPGKARADDFWRETYVNETAL